jgi:hypothetical protein
MADTDGIAECVKVRSASLKSHVPATEFGLWDLPTVSTVLHLPTVSKVLHLPTVSTVLHFSCSAEQGILAHSIHKAWLQKHFSLQVSEPLNSATDVE